VAVAGSLNGLTCTSALPGAHVNQTDLQRTSVAAAAPQAMGLPSDFVDVGDWFYGLLNRGLALGLLIVLAPVLLAVASFIRVRDGAPVLFGHYRVGQHGKLFKCWKFRTMAPNAAELLKDLLERDPVASAEWERDFKLSNDPRITRVGAFLRKTSLDELPQLINVLLGEMRLVGPRPITLEELRRYGASRGHYLAVQPGITGLWQVSGRSNLSYPERVALDRHYVESRTWLADVGILFKTVKVVVFCIGAR
jgi:exopolysaccharide production protein ExoY